MNKNPINLISYQKSYKFQTLIHDNIIDYVESISRNFSYFFKNLSYSKSQCPKYLNPDDDSKHLKLIDLFCILDGLEKRKELQFEIIETLALQYGFTLINNEKELSNKDSLENLLLKLTSTNGNLSTNFLEAVEDGIITDIEKEKLLSIAIQFRSLLRIFENRVEDLYND